MDSEPRTNGQSPVDIEEPRTAIADDTLRDIVTNLRHAYAGTTHALAGLAAPPTSTTSTRTTSPGRS